MGARADAASHLEIRQLSGADRCRRTAKKPRLPSRSLDHTQVAAARSHGQSKRDHGRCHQGLREDSRRLRPAIYFVFFSTHFYFRPPIDFF